MKFCAAVAEKISKMLKVYVGRWTDDGRTTRYDNSSLELRSGELKTTILVGDHDFFFPTKFNENLFSGSGEEVEYV